MDNPSYEWCPEHQCWIDMAPVTFADLGLPEPEDNKEDLKDG